MLDPADLASRLDSRVAGYFPDLTPPLWIRFDGLDRRARSHLYRFTVLGGAGERRVIVKVPVAAIARRPSRRPRLLPDADLGEKPRLEFEALQTVERRFAPLDDRRFGTIRALDLLPDAAAIVMQEASGRPLSGLLAKAARVRVRSDRAHDRVAKAIANAGAWLRIYHDTPVDALPTAYPGRDDLTGFVSETAMFLKTESGRRRFFEGVDDRIRELAADLPSRLPLGLRHGDFEMRNVLVDAGGSVTVIDMLAHWRAPVYDDLARMLVGLHAGRPQAYSLGFAFERQRMAELERTFLGAYLEPGSPLLALRLFEVLALLDRWASMAERAGRGRPGILARVTDLHYRRLVGRFLAEAESAVRSGASLEREAGGGRVDRSA